MSKDTQEKKTLKTAQRDDMLRLTHGGRQCWERQYSGHYIELPSGNEKARWRILFDIWATDGVRIGQLLSTSTTYSTSRFIRKYTHRGIDHEKALQGLILEGLVEVKR